LETGFVCAVDVGTGSARAGILDARGSVLGRAEHPIAMNRPAAEFAEQDSQNIWSAVCLAVRAAREKAGIDAEAVVGIAFDATCSLVVRDRAGGQLSVSTSGDPRWDTIAWLDHRAIAEADECTRGGHAVVASGGGVMSPEMVTP
jgi:ribulose kinase